MIIFCFDFLDIVLLDVLFFVIMWKIEDDV